MVADDDDDVPGRLLRPLFIAMGNFLEKVGTAMAPTGRHTERYVFFIAFSTRLINERVHVLYVRHIENPPESLSSSQTQDGFDSLVCTRCHTQGTLLAQGGTVRTTTDIKNHLFQRESRDYLHLVHVHRPAARQSPLHPRFSSTTSYFTTDNSKYQSIPLLSTYHHGHSR